MEHLEGSGTPVLYIGRTVLNTLKAKLNPICHLLALLGAHLIFHVSRIRVKYTVWSRLSMRGLCGLLVTLRDRKLVMTRDVGGK